MRTNQEGKRREKLRGAMDTVLGAHGRVQPGTRRNQVVTDTPISQEDQRDLMSISVGAGSGSCSWDQ